MSFADFFHAATGNNPYDYQRRLACGEHDSHTENEWLNGGTDCASRLISIPTGLGKTAAVTMAWLWNRVALGNDSWPCRLVYCLPMRTLVEQTRDEISKWLTDLIEATNKGNLSLDDDARTQLEWLATHSPVILMGGEENDAARREWDIHPEKPAILIGTQDMLLSRALNRGYGMSRARWPMHFGLLNNDALWVMDETQLMGPGLWTSTQLDWLRQDRFKSLRNCLTWWMSATVDESFLATKDRDAAADKLPALAGKIDITPTEVDHLAILAAQRPLRWWTPPKSAVTRKGKTKKVQNEKPRDLFLAALGQAVLNEYAPGSLSLVVCNSVATAQKLFETLMAGAPGKVVLLTSRFRPQDRSQHLNVLLEFERARKEAIKKNTQITHPGLICVSTQVVEAGVDISARRLWTELSPWPSTLQRLGRLNRDARLNGEALAFVFELPPGKTEKGQKNAQTGPYEATDIADAKKIITACAKQCDATTSRPIREILEQLTTDTAIGKLIKNSLRAKPEPFPRAFEVHGLFSTEPDAFGGFTDVSPWIRGNDANADVTVFWRDWDAAKKNPNTPEHSGPAYQRDEGCPVTVYRLRGFVTSAKAAFKWNDKTGKWENIRSKEICPGMVILLPASAGGYSDSSGWTGDKKSRFACPLPPPGPFDADSDDDDKLTEVKRQWVTLDQHLAAVAFDAERIGKALALPDPLLIALTRAAALHDIGKSFPQWQDALPEPRPDESTFWAKAPYFAQRARMRHEAASALTAWHCYYHTDVAFFPALTIYLIAAHHGLVRTALASRVNAPQPNVCGIPVTIPPPELPWRPNPTDKWTFDFTCAQDGVVGEFTKDADDRDIFIPAAPGWTALVADLLGGWEANAPKAAAGAVPINEPQTLNPFNLAFLEALLRAADWRVSANETGIPADPINLQTTPEKKS